MGRLGALLHPTCASYAGCAQWTTTRRIFFLISYAEHSRVKTSPSGWKYREEGIGVHFLQAQPGRHVFSRAKGAVVWLFQKRRPYMIVKAAHRRPEGPL